MFCIDRTTARPVGLLAVGLMLTAGHAAASAEDPVDQVAGAATAASPFAGEWRVRFGDGRVSDELLTIEEIAADSADKGPRFTVQHPDTSSVSTAHRIETPLGESLKFTYAFDDDGPKALRAQFVLDPRDADRAFLVYETYPEGYSPFDYVVEQAVRVVQQALPKGAASVGPRKALPPPLGRWTMPSLCVGCDEDRNPGDNDHFFEVSRSTAGFGGPTACEIRYVNENQETVVNSVFTGNRLSGGPLKMPFKRDTDFVFELIPNPTDERALFLEATAILSETERYTLWFSLVKDQEFAGKAAED